ncbi:Putative fasciclin-like arabinogalactan protein 20 [Apostasia shenzhenica]|uniref:Fasciclin-like arabinogalactan protein 20 n=1 Tax=Apostasia shenzhenica TaxID=1088818 RepID=A0A2I0AWT1_9ASPA|nr:Putative fasciclin-like arabinogalactan protein 20 [Apostasia shenzhenica]
MAFVFLLLLLSSFPLSLSLSISPSTLLNSTVALLSSGFVSMSLILEAAAPSLLPTSSPFTLFSPPDSSFSSYGQPPLSILRLHISPRYLPPSSLRSLPFSSKIPSLSQTALTVTTSPTDTSISINGVSVNDTAIFDDGTLAIYGTKDFFDPAFDILSLPPPDLANPNFECRPPDDHRPLAGASERLRSGGFSAMAGYLDLQLQRIRSAATIFAPADAALGVCQGNLTEQVEIFRRHVVPCKLKGKDLAGMPSGATLPTFLEGFTVGVETSNGRLLANGVAVTDPDLYDDDLVAVHGVREILKPLYASLEFSD